MSDSKKLRRLVEDLQKDRPRAVRPGPSQAWSDALDALRRDDEPPPVNPQPASGMFSGIVEPQPETQSVNPVQQAEPEQQTESRWPTPKTPKQKAIQEFVDEIWPDSQPRTATIKRYMKDKKSKRWKSIAVDHGLGAGPPDDHTINVALGREVR